MFMHLNMIHINTFIKIITGVCHTFIKISVNC